MDNGHEHVLIDDGSGNVLGSLGNPVNVQQALAGAAISPQNPVPIYDAYQAPVASSWNSATAAGVGGVGATVSVPTSGYDGVLMSLVATGTVSGGHITFEVYDGQAWLPVKGFALESYFSYQGYALATGLNNGLQFDIAGCSSFRVRLDTAISGAGSVRVALTASSAPLVPGLAVGLDPTATAQPVGTGALNTGQGAVGTTAALLVAARTGAVGTGRVAVTITNNGAAVIYVGNAGVTTATGKAIWPGASATLATTAAIYAVSGSAAQAADYVESF